MLIASKFDDVVRATGAGVVRDDFVGKLSRITQLTGESWFSSAQEYPNRGTGFSDPVYVEAVVTVSQFDILLGLYEATEVQSPADILVDLLIINQTTTTLQNLTVEFATLGDLKLVERPAPYTLGPHAFHHISATVKVLVPRPGVSDMLN